MKKHNQNRFLVSWVTKEKYCCMIIAFVADLVVYEIHSHSHSLDHPKNECETHHDLRVPSFWKLPCVAAGTLYCMCTNARYQIWWMEGFLMALEKNASNQSQNPLLKPQNLCVVTCSTS